MRDAGLAVGHLVVALGVDDALEGVAVVAVADRVRDAAMRAVRRRRRRSAPRGPGGRTGRPTGAEAGAALVGAAVIAGVVLQVLGDGERVGMLLADLVVDPLHRLQPSGRSRRRRRPRTLRM